MMRLRSPVGLPEFPLAAAFLFAVLFTWPFVVFQEAWPILLWESGAWALAILVLALLSRRARDDDEHVAED